jgi:hypothetical protein
MNTNGNAFSFFAMKHPCVDSHFFPLLSFAPLAHKRRRRRCAGGEKNSLSNLYRRARSQICVHDAAAARERAHNSRSACLSGNMASSVYGVYTHAAACIYLFCTTAALGADYEEMRQLESNLSCVLNSRIIYTLDAALIFIQFAGADITQM